MRMVLATATIVAMLVHSAVAAPPPEDSDDYKVMHPYADVITSQHDQLGRWCCTVADGRPVDTHITGDGHWQVRFIHPETLSDDVVKPPPIGWVDVPDEVVIHGPNPIGVPIAWWYRGSVRCFLPASGT